MFDTTRLAKKLVYFLMIPNIKSFHQYRQTQGQPLIVPLISASKYFKYQKFEEEYLTSKSFISSGNINISSTGSGNKLKVRSSPVKRK
jgi:hypothetical protein